MGISEGIEGAGIGVMIEDGVELGRVEGVHGRVEEVHGRAWLEYPLAHDEDGVVECPGGWLQDDEEILVVQPPAHLLQLGVLVPDILWQGHPHIPLFKWRQQLYFPNGLVGGLFFVEGKLCLLSVAAVQAVVPIHVQILLHCDRFFLH